MKEYSYKFRASNRAEIDAHFDRVLAHFGFNHDGTPMATSSDSCNPAGGHQEQSHAKGQAEPGSLNANLPGQLEFFSARVTSQGLIFEMIVTDE